MKCTLCEKRKPKRFCPATRSMICPTCCGEKRGVEINCPSDCKFFVEGRAYHENKVTKRRLKKEGASSFVRRAGLYNRNPLMFQKIEEAMVRNFRAYADISNSEISQALELVQKTLETEMNGLIYEHKSGRESVDHLAFEVTETIRAVKDNPEVGRGRVKLQYLSDIIKEFQNEVLFYINAEQGENSYLTHLARYYPEKTQASASESKLIIT